MPRGEWVVFPDDAVSGYGGDLRFWGRLADHIREGGLAGVDSVRNRHVFVGSLLREAGAWVDAVVYLPPSGEPRPYTARSTWPTQAGGKRSGGAPHLSGAAPRGP